jgi:hypothetical protein
LEALDRLVVVYISWMRRPELRIQAPVPSALTPSDPAPEVAADNAGETSNEKVGAEVKGASSGI